MADEVQISNVGGDGVASEVTLARLVTSIEAMAKKMGIDNKGPAAKLQKLYNQEVKDSVKSTKEQTDATIDQTDATKDVTQATNKFAASLGGAVAKGLGSLVQSAMNLGNAFWNNNTSIEGFASQLPLVGKLLGGLGGIADESINSFRSLTASGASFGGSITNMRNAAAGMEISLSEMTNLFTAQAPALAALGGTVEEGAARFQKMNKNIKATGDFRSLMQMGFSVEEVNSGMADYISLQGRMGRLQGQSTAELADGSANYLRQIDLLAKVTGKTREQAQALLDQQAADSVARTLLGQFKEGSQEYRNLSSSLALLDEVGGASAEALKGMLTENLTPAAGKFMAMLGDSGDTVHAAMMEVGKGADPQVLLNAFKTAGGKLEEFAGADAAGRVSIIRALRDAGDPMADYLDGAGKMIDLGNRDMVKAREQQAAQRAVQDEATATMLAFEETQRKVSAAFQKAFIESGILDLFAKGLEAVAPLLTSFATSLSNFATAFGTDGLVAAISTLSPAIAAFVDKISKGEWVSALSDAFVSGIKSIWENKGIIGALVGGIGVLFAAKAASAALTRSIGNRISGMFGGGGAAPAGAAPGGARPGRAGASAGGAIGNIGAGIGKGLGGVLKGLANGIAAFANPAVLLGGTNIALVIVGIGAAVAGATWMVGAALPTMAEGMKSFEELNGSKLVDAGLGMLSVAAGLAAIGAGGVAGAVGGAASGLIDGISGFFGAESPLDKMLAFQKYDFDADKIENNSRAMVAYSQGMALMGGAGVVSGIGGAIGAFGGAIAGLFGADSPLDKISLFQAYDFDPTKIANNASAIESYSKGMAALGSAEAVGGVGSILGAIGGWFSGNNDMPWESVKAFGDADLNLAGVTANAAAVNAMSTSLNGFSVENLDTTGVVNYTSAMERLVEVLGELNEELSKDNNGWSAGTGTNAGDVMATAGMGGGGNSDQLNNTMQQVLMVLNQMMAIDEDVERNTRNIIGSNLAQGGVSNVGR